MTAPDLDRESAADLPLLRRLAAVGAGDGGPVVSLYLDLSAPEETTPRSRIAEIEALADAARQRYTDAEEHRRESEQPPVRQIIDEARRFLEEEFEPGGARGVATFASASASGPALETVPLRHGVAPGVVVDRRAALRPLIEAKGWLAEARVAIVTRDEIRVLALRGGRLTELHHEHEDHVPRRNRTSEGAAQHRAERWTREEAAQAAKLVAGGRREAGSTPLVVFAPPPLLRPLEEAIGEHHAGGVVAAVPVDATGRSPDDLLAEVGRALDEQEDAVERRLAENLAQGAGQAGTSVEGDGPTLAALRDRRVATLLLQRGRSLEGWECPSCGLLSTQGGACPVEGSTMQPVRDLTEPMIRAALDQSAAVRSLPEDLLRGAGSAALLRFGG